jgi:hypothetical protein
MYVQLSDPLEAVYEKVMGLLKKKKKEPAEQPASILASANGVRACCCWQELLRLWGHPLNDVSSKAGQGGATIAALFVQGFARAGCLGAVWDHGCPILNYHHTAFLSTGK